MSACGHMRTCSSAGLTKLLSQHLLLVRLHDDDHNEGMVPCTDGSVQEPSPCTNACGFVAVVSHIVYRLHHSTTEHDWSVEMDHVH